MNVFPLLITPRLMIGVQVGNNSWISIEAKNRLDNGRYIYTYYIDTPDFEYVASDLEAHGCVAQRALESLLSFLSAAAESYRYCMTPGRHSENRDLFPNIVMEWAYLNSSELEILQLEIEQQLENSPCKTH